MTLKLAFCLALFLGLTVVTQGLAEGYYIYRTAKGELVISNKQAPPGSTIIKQLPGETEKELTSAQEPGKTPPNVKPEDSAKPTKNRARATPSYNNSSNPVADCIPWPNLRRLRVGLHVQVEPIWPAA